MDEDVPMCATCQHRHVLGVRCDICGHTGKSNIFSKMQSRSAEKQRFRWEFFEIPYSSDAEGLLSVTREIRKQVFEQEMGLQYNSAADSLADYNSRHLIGFLGDSPIVAARWRLETTLSGVIYADIDRFAVVPRSRRCGYGKQSLLFIFDDIRHVHEIKGRQIASVQILVPAFCSWCGQYLERLGFFGIPSGSDVLYSRGL